MTRHTRMLAAALMVALLALGRMASFVEDGAFILHGACFRSEVGNNVTIGERAIVVGVTLPDGTTIPEDAVITTQGQVDALID